jgi:nuclear pore complex protein Nup155
MVAMEFERIGRRVNLNENVFPVNVLLQLLLQYDLNYYTHDIANNRRSPDEDRLPCGNLTWPLEPFIKLGAPFEIMVATLEALWYAQEPPFDGRNRRLLVKWIIYLVETWYKESSRQGVPFGSEENAIGLMDCLRTVVQSGELGRETTLEQAWVERGRAALELVEQVTR